VRRENITKKLKACKNANEIPDIFNGAITPAAIAPRDAFAVVESIRLALEKL